MSTLSCLLMTCKSQLCANTVPIVFMSWPTYTTQHYQTLLIYTLLLSPRPSNHGHLSHGTVWRSKRQEERDGKQKENGVVPLLVAFKVKKKYATDLMIRSRCEFYKNIISENSSDQKMLFSATKKGCL